MNKQKIKKKKDLPKKNQNKLLMQVTVITTMKMPMKKLKRSQKRKLDIT